MNFSYNLLNSLDVFKKYQLEIDILFRHVKWIDLRTGQIVLSEALINQEFKPMILEQLPDYIKQLQFGLVENLIRMDLIGDMKGFRFKVGCDMSFERFEFTPNSHKVVLAIHHESVTAEKGRMNRILMRIVNPLFMGRIGKIMVHSAIEERPEMTFNSECKQLVIDLERLPEFKKYLEVAVLGKPLLHLVEMELMGVDEKGIRIKLLLQKPPIPSMTEVMGALGL